MQRATEHGIKINRLLSQNKPRTQAVLAQQILDRPFKSSGTQIEF
jgi:hypothetical protein